jgi:hypothetical protein
MYSCIRELEDVCRSTSSAHSSSSFHKRSIQSLSPNLITSSLEVALSVYGFSDYPYPNNCYLVKDRVSCARIQNPQTSPSFWSTSALLI